MVLTDKRTIKYQLLVISSVDMDIKIQKILCFRHVHSATLQLIILVRISNFKFSIFRFIELNTYLQKNN
jgi:hypothetical protein